MPVAVSVQKHAPPGKLGGITDGHRGALHSVGAGLKVKGNGLGEGLKCMVRPRVGGSSDGNGGAIRWDGKGVGFIYVQCQRGARVAHSDDNLGGGGTSR